MPHYIITVKAPKETAELVFQLIVFHLKAYVRAEAFTDKPYEHLHAVIAVRCEISYKKVHKALEELRHEIGNFWLGFRLIRNKKDVVLAIKYVKNHDRGDEAVSEDLRKEIEELKDRVNQIAEALDVLLKKAGLSKLLNQKTAGKTKAKSEGRAELYINNTKISIIESKKDGYKLVIFERKKDSFKLWLSKDDWKVLRRFMDSYISFNSDRAKRAGKTNFKVIKGGELG